MRWHSFQKVDLGGAPAMMTYILEETGHQTLHHSGQLNGLRSSLQLVLFRRKHRQEHGILTLPGCAELPSFELRASEIE